MPGNLKYKYLYIVSIFLLMMFFNAAALLAGDATLSWDPPTTNSDETPLTDLAGYKLYYGTTSGSYTDNIDVGNVTTYQITNLTDGLTYYFGVTAYDTSGNESDYSNEISKTIGSPPAADPNGPYTGTEGQAITLDGSGSTDSDGTITLYEWDIDNDGTYEYSSSSPIQSHTYAEQGTYTVNLRVTDNLDATDEASTTATITDTTPTSDFTGTPTSGTASFTVNFTDNSTGYDQPLSHEWDFDNDGTIDSTVQNPSNTYNTAGTYTVKLTVTDSDGSANYLSKTDYITAASPVYRLTVDINSNGTVISSPSGIDCPGDCSEQYTSGEVITLTATPESGYLFDSWSACSSSDGEQCTVTMNSETTITATFITDEKSLSCPDAGSIECLERTDGGSESDNLDNGMPRVDIEYKFRITLKDTSGNTPQYIKLYMTQRNNPEAGEFYANDMSCSEDYSTGGLCTYSTKLGPAAVHKFYFEAKMYDNTILRYPGTGYITGPEVRLLTDYNMVGIAREIGSDILDSSTAFGSTLAYRWDAELEYYTLVTTTEPVKAGEGYFVESQTNTLPELAGYGEKTDTEFIYELKPGWNIISNPYGGNVRLLNINVRKGNNTPVTWAEATTNGWVTNAIYYYNGTDWGDTYGFETETDATLVPWMGYWMNLEATDDIYYLVIPKP